MKRDASILKHGGLAAVLVAISLTAVPVLAGNDDCVNFGDRVCGDYPCPTNLTAVPHGNGDIQLQWTPAAGSISTSIYRAPAGSGMALLMTTGGSSLLDTTATPGQAYEYTAIADFAGGSSNRCPLVQVSSIPSFPSALAVVAAVGGSIAAYAGFRRRA